MFAKCKMKIKKIVWRIVAIYICSLWSYNLVSNYLKKLFARTLDPTMISGFRLAYEHLPTHQPPLLCHLNKYWSLHVMTIVRKNPIEQIDLTAIPDQLPYDYFVFVSVSVSVSVFFFDSLLPITWATASKAACPPDTKWDFSIWTARQTGRPPLTASFVVRCTLYVVRCRLYVYRFGWIGLAAVEMNSIVKCWLCDKSQQLAL